MSADPDNFNTFTMRIELDNAAFAEDGEDDSMMRSEIARILRHQADRVERGDYYRGHSQTILDVNGNDVGRGKIHPKR